MFLRHASHSKNWIETFKDVSFTLTFVVTGAGGGYGTRNQQIGEKCFHAGRGNGDAAERVHFCFVEKPLSEFETLHMENIDIVTTVTASFLLKVEDASSSFLVPAEKQIVLARAHAIYAIVTRMRIRAYEAKTLL